MWIVYPLIFTMKSLFHSWDDCIMSYCFHDHFNSSSSCIHFRTFPFSHNSLEKQLCIDSFSFFSLFKKVLSLWIFSEDALIDELWFQHCFLDWLSSGVSFSLWVCLLKLVLWSSWTQFSTLSTAIPMHFLFSVFLLFLEVWRIPTPLLTLEEKCHVNLWACRFLFLISLEFEKILTLLTQLFSGTEYMIDAFAHELLVVFIIILMKQSKITCK